MGVYLDGTSGTDLAYDVSTLMDNMTALSVWARAKKKGSGNDIVTKWHYSTDLGWVLIWSNSGYWHAEWAYNDTNNTDTAQVNNAFYECQYEWHTFFSRWSTTTRDLTVDGLTGTADTDSRTTISDTAADLIIGGQSDGEGNNWTGDIGQVAIWSVYLSLAEEASLRAGADPASIQSDNLIFYAPLTSSSDLDDEIGSITPTSSNIADGDLDEPLTDDASYTSASTFSIPATCHTDDTSRQSFIDHFRATNSRWGTDTASSGSATWGGDDLNLNPGTVNADAAIGYFATKLDKAVNQIWEIRYIVDTGDGEQYPLWIIDKSTAPVCEATSTFEARLRMLMHQASDNTFEISYFSSSHTKNYWNEAGTAWTTSTSDAHSYMSGDEYHVIRFELDADNSRFRFMIASHPYNATPGQDKSGIVLNVLTDWVALSALETANSDLWLGFGWPETDGTPANTRDLLIDQVTYTEGDKYVAWVNYNHTGDAGFPQPYEIGQAHGYGKDDGIILLVPESSTCTVLDIGAGGEDDDVFVKDPFVIESSSGTFYMFYQGYDGTNGHIMVASASSVDGPWTKQATILSPTSTYDFAFPWVIEDLGASASERWKLWCGYNAATWDLVYSYSSSPTSGWSAPATVLSNGASGEFDDDGLELSIIRQLDDGTFEMFYSGYDGSSVWPIWKVGRATSPNLTSGGTWTRDTNLPLTAYDEETGMVDDDSAASRTFVRSSTNQPVRQQFKEGMPVILHNSGGSYATFNRIRKINGLDDIEMYHSANWSAIVSTYPIKSTAIAPRMNFRAKGVWYSFVTTFSSSTNTDHEYAVLDHSFKPLPIDPQDWQCRFDMSPPWPPQYLADDDAQLTYNLENISILTQPLEAGEQVIGPFPTFFRV